MNNFFYKWWIEIDRINFIPDGSFGLTPFLLFSFFLIIYLLIFEIITNSKVIRRFKIIPI